MDSREVQLALQALEGTHSPKELTQLAFQVHQRAGGTGGSRDKRVPEWKGLQDRLGRDGGHVEGKGDKACRDMGRLWGRDGMG